MRRIFHFLYRKKLKGQNIFLRILERSGCKDRPKRYRNVSLSVNTIHKKIILYLCLNLLTPLSKVLDTLPCPEDVRVIYLYTHTLQLFTMYWFMKFSRHSDYRESHLKLFIISNFICISRGSFNFTIFLSYYSEK